MASSKLTGLTANTTPALTDLVYLVDDPGGTPLSQKITVAALLATPSATLVTPVLGAATGTSLTATGLLQAGTTIGISTDVLLNRDAAGVLAQRDGTNAQTFRVYSTFTDASNYERGFFRYTGSGLEIGHEGAGTGTSSRMLRIKNGPTAYFELDSGGNAYSSSSIGVASKFLLSSPSTGVMTLFNWDLNDFARLQFGGTTSSFPALKRSTTNLQVRLADDSAYAPIDASAYKVAGAAGVSFGPAAVASITVVNGIVTAIS